MNLPKSQRCCLARRPDSASPNIALSVPDLFAALQEKSGVKFGFWVRTLNVPTLKAVIRANGFDPAKASQRWTDPDKFVALVADLAVARSQTS